MAMIFAQSISKYITKSEQNKIRLVTFGAPRVGKRDFAEELSKEYKD